MKYFLLLSLLISFTFASEQPTKKRQRQLHLDDLDLRKEIFMKEFYKEYSFELLQQIPVKSVVVQRAFGSLLSQGMQKYCRIAVHWDAAQNGPLKPFDEFSLSELESFSVN